MTSIGAVDHIYGKACTGALNAYFNAVFTNNFRRLYNMLKFICMALVACTIIAPMTSHATYVFTDVAYTSNTVTFTIDGDMTGYQAPSISPDQFSIRYTPGMVDSEFTPNVSWAPNVFDNKTLADVGNTGLFSSTIPYSWSIYFNSLANSVATMNTVTLTMQGDWLNPGFDASDISFWWGNGLTNNSSNSNPTFLGVDAAVVPIPAAIWLMGTGLIGLIGISRKNKIQSTV